MLLKPLSTPLGEDSYLFIAWYLLTTDVSFQDIAFFHNEIFGGQLSENGVKVVHVSMLENYHLEPDKKHRPPPPSIRWPCRFGYDCAQRGVEKADKQHIRLAQTSFQFDTDVWRHWSEHKHSKRTFAQRSSRPLSPPPSPRIVFPMSYDLLYWNDMGFFRRLCHPKRWTQFPLATFLERNSWYGLFPKSRLGSPNRFFMFFVNIATLGIIATSLYILARYGLTILEAIVLINEAFLTILKYYVYEQIRNRLTPYNALQFAFGKYYNDTIDPARFERVSQKMGDVADKLLGKYETETPDLFPGTDVDGNVNTFWEIFKRDRMQQVINETNRLRRYLNPNIRIGD